MTKEEIDSSIKKLISNQEDIKTELSEIKSFLNTLKKNEDNNPDNKPEENDDNEDGEDDSLY